MKLAFALPILVLAIHSVGHGAPVSLFDGKTFNGWEGDTEKVWRIADGQIIAGTPDSRQPRNEFLVTRKDYGDFELTLQYRRGDNNGGIQIRSERVPHHHEMSGYQADFAPGIDGFLYDESRRKRFLALFDIERGPVDATPEDTGAAIKRANQSGKEVARRLNLQEWNHYRIRCEGPRIRLWINGVLTVDYAEKDSSIPLRGKIGLQIHGGATEIRYKELFLEEIQNSLAAPTRTAPSFKLEAQDTIALVGGSNIERTRLHGYLQTSLIGAVGNSKIRVRNFGWEGDTVFEQWRDHGSSDPSKSWRQQRDWKDQLKEAGANVVFVQFGQMESLRGENGILDFTNAYERLLEDVAAEGRRVVLLSPTLFEGNMAVHNPFLMKYAETIRDLAARRGFVHVDLTRLGSKSAPLTENGWQWNERGHKTVAAAIAKSLSLRTVEDEAARRQVLEMERLWFDSWRPMNWAFLTGDRTSVAYSRDWKDSSKRIFPQEMLDFAPLLDLADENIWNALAGKPITPIGIRSSIPVEPSTVEPQTPEEELASFKILDGFSVNLFASERDGIVKPIQMRWDERGRLWVACAVSYPQVKPGEKANDYVLVCEDTDGDGRADKFHKFVEGLFMPSGIELGDGGLYVAQGTELLHFEDTDGDGRADKKRIILGGFGTADSHQMINGLNWGFGGELWFTQGHHIYSRVETPYGVETLNRAGVWRWRQRTGHLDPFFQHSSGGVNCWGVVTTPYGQPFHKSGANTGAWFSTPGLIRSSLAVNAQAMNVFTAPMKQVGMDFVRSSHFPPQMQGRAVIGGYYANLLEWHELKLEGGVYSSQLLPNLIETTNTVFRPVEIRNGPDGALYFADWYNPIIGHYQASYRHPDRDKEHGRIWRMTVKDRPTLPVKDLGQLSTDELLELMDSTEGWAQYQAKRLLFGRGTQEVIAALDVWLPKQVISPRLSGEKTEYRRLQALALYEAHETVRIDLLRALLRSEYPEVRAYATRVTSTWARDGKLPQALELLETQVADEDPLVRLEAVVAASYIPDARAAAVAARVLDREFNVYHKHALTKMLHVSNALWAPLLCEEKFEFDRDEHLLFALQNGWVENRLEDFRNNWGGAIAYQFQASTRAAEIMKARVNANSANSEKMLMWLRAFAALAQPLDIPFVLERGSRDVLVVAAIKAQRPEGAEQLLADLLNSANEAIKAQAARLAGAWRVSELADILRQLEHDPSLSIRENAFGALLSIEPERTVRRVLQRVETSENSTETAGLLLAVSGKTESLEAFVRLVNESDTLSQTAAKRALKALNVSGKGDPQLAKALMRAAGINASLPPYTAEYIKRIVKTAASAGNASEGKKIYETVGCASCHLPGLAQSHIGPDLSTISRGLPIDMIVTEVLWPALNVKENYEAAHVVMKDGSVITGFKHTDTPETLSIRELSGAIRQVRKGETQSIKVGGTLMPEGVTGHLSELQLAHLIRYLGELGK